MIHLHQRAPTSTLASFAPGLVLLPLPSRRSRFKGACNAQSQVGCKNKSSTNPGSKVSASTSAPPAHPPQFAVATPVHKLQSSGIIAPVLYLCRPPSFPIYQTARLQCLTFAMTLFQLSFHSTWLPCSKMFEWEIDGTSLEGSGCFGEIKRRML